MLRRKLNTMLILAGLGFSSGCASDGFKMPLSDKFTSLGTFGKESAGGPGSKDELSSEFREAQKVFKKDPEGSLLAWARWQEDIGEYGEARKRYRELLIAYPDNIEAELGLARIELSCGRVKQAEDILLGVAKHRPKNTPVRLELGRLYTQQEDWPKAIAAFEEASAVDPENQICRYELGIAFARSHRFDQALSHLTYAVGESAAHYNIGYIMHEQGKDVDAAEWLRNALQTHPDTQTVQRTHALLAQISPKNSRDLKSAPTYPSEQPSTEFLAARLKQNNLDQYEPRSFEAPVIRAATTMRTEPSDQALPFVASNVNPGPDRGTLLPPVNPRPVQYGMANTGSPSSGNLPDYNPIQTISHSVSPNDSEPVSPRKSQLPQWKGAADQASNTTPAPEAQQQQQGTTLAKWRGRQD